VKLEDGQPRPGTPLPARHPLLKLLSGPASHQADRPRTAEACGCLALLGALRSFSMHHSLLGRRPRSRHTLRRMRGQQHAGECPGARRLLGFGRATSDGLFQLSLGRGACRGKPGFRGWPQHRRGVAARHRAISSGRADLPMTTQGSWLLASDSVSGYGHAQTCWRDRLG